MLVAGAVVGGAFDYSSTKAIANVAYNAFIDGDVNDDVDFKEAVWKSSN